MSNLIESLAAEQPKVGEWLTGFAALVASGAGPTDIAHELSMMGVLDPEEPDEFPGDPLFDWLKANQSRYNRAVRESIDSRPGLRQQLRAVFGRDLKTTHPTLEDCGMIVCKRYSRNLLEHFLTAKPDPKWVG